MPGNPAYPTGPMRAFLNGEIVFILDDVQSAEEFFRQCVSYGVEHRLCGTMEAMESTQRDIKGGRSIYIRYDKIRLTLWFELADTSRLPYVRYRDDDSFFHWW